MRVYEYFVGTQTPLRVVPVDMFIEGADRVMRNEGVALYPHAHLAVPFKFKLTLRLMIGLLRRSTCVGQGSWGIEDVNGCMVGS